MFDIAWSHLLVIALVALVVIGPKDLPRVMRMVGGWVGKARAVAREFQSSLDQMVREAELHEMRKEVEEAGNVDLRRELRDTIDPDREMERSLAKPLTAAAPSIAAAPAPAAPAKSDARD
jgi:sec-independent protein translocase protein TatB